MICRARFLNILSLVITVCAYLVLVISIYFICYKLPLSWTVENFSRKTGPLRYDSFAVLGYIASFLCLSLIVRLRYVYAITIIIVSLVALSIASSWLYYDFYKDFVVADTLRLLPDLINGGAAGALNLLASYDFTLVLFWSYLSFLVAFVGLGLRKSIDNKERKALYSAFLLFVVFGGVNQYKFHAVDSNVVFADARMPPVDVNPASYFFRSFFDNGLALEFSPAHIEAIKLINQVAINDNYPLYKENYTPSNRAADVSDKKNVIVLVLESVRAAETGFFSNNKQSATPNIDRIAKQTDAFINYYSNSVQTVRAELSILCSILDFSRGTPFSRRGVELPTRCLPSILKENGYNNLWFHGNEKTYFNRNHFLPVIGFDELHDEEVMLEAKPDSQILGWGISDKDALQYAFDVLSKESEPFFAEILTLSNHFPFDFNFAKSSQESTGYSTVYNNFLRGVQYTDDVVGSFWKMFQNSKLKNNTILIITSDHGLWFEEKIFEDVYVANEALFRVPLMIWNPENNKKPEVYNTVSSHVDITPTILNMLGISAKNTALMGEDLYAKKRRELALITGFGGYAVRSKSQFCFPAVGSEEKGYYVEEKIKNPHNIICRPTSNNALQRNYKNEVPVVLASPSKKYQKIIEFNDISLLKGFMPQEVIGVGRQ
jgi:phosphoglycerol transferase MdoB-like AlkP superfamily enzyme